MTADNNLFRIINNNNNNNNSNSNSNTRHPDIVLLNSSPTERGRSLSHLSYDHIDFLCKDLDTQPLSPPRAAVLNILNGGYHAISVYLDLISRMEAANMSTSNVLKAREHLHLLSEYTSSRENVPQ